ncbi:MAG: hypothetical protein DIU76_11460, partial [Bacillota bacterium]
DGSVEEGARRAAEGGLAAAGATRATEAAGEGQGVAVAAPLPGVLLEVRVRPGDRVEAGQVVAILEAMKMENELTAPCAGRVAAVPRTKGQTLDQGDVVAWIEPEG